MVLTYRQRKPYLYDKDGQRKLSTYVCRTCGKVARGKFPKGWIGAFASAYCSDKCYFSKKVTWLI